MFKKQIIIAVMAFFFSISLAIENSFALEPENKLGTLSIYLEASSKETASVDGVEFELFKVADVINGEYVLTKELKNVSLDLNSLENGTDLQNSANTLSDEITVKKMSGIKKKTNSRGFLSYNDLEVGVYLFKAIDINNYDNISPSLVAIPTFDSNTNSTNDMNYNVSVVPKHSPIIAAETGDDWRMTDKLIILGSTALFIKLIKSKKGDIAR